MITKRGMVDKQGESMVARFGYLEVNPIRAYKGSGAMSVMFPVCMPYSSISEEFLLFIFSGLK